MKIIASDFDGTLFQENGVGISDEDRVAIGKFRSLGGLFGIVTGRDLTASEKVFDSIGEQLDFLICSTGAIICDGKGNIVSQTKTNCIDAICKIGDFALKNNVASFSVINEKQRLYLDTDSKSADKYKKLTEFNNCTIWFKTIEDAKITEDYLNENHSTDFTFFRNFECIEITPLGVNKATAVKKLASKFQSPSIFTVGDGTTDIPMVTEFCGFAVENANPILQNVAPHHCKRVCDMIDTVLES